MLLTIAKMIPTSLRSSVKSALNSTPFLSWVDDMHRISRRRAFAMAYFTNQLDFIKQWSKRYTEDSNFYYRLTENNRDHLAQLISTITGETYQEVIGYFEEIENDQSLRDHINKALKTSSYGKDISVEYGRRIGWYAFTRIMKPKVVIETGIDHGVGSCVLASALLRNAAEGSPGRYYGTEISPAAGKLFCGEYATVGEILYGDSIESLSKLSEPIDLFINDSDHSATYEYNEYVTIKDKLSPKSFMLGDNSHVTNCLSRFSREMGRKFVFFSEKPADHWYPGAGIGISLCSIAETTRAIK